eukprot:1154524-Pelagomonas_calceolata.AAC.4
MSLLILETGRRDQVICMNGSSFLGKAPQRSSTIYLNVPLLVSLLSAEALLLLSHMVLRKRKGKDRACHCRPCALQTSCACLRWPRALRKGCKAT